MDSDEKYMRRCLQLAANGLQGAKPNPMVGAVIVAPTSPEHIIGEGYHVRCGQGHAEVNAFASVRPEDESLLRESTLYVSLEPCAHHGKTPPCADLIVSKGIRRVVVGCVDPFEQVQGRGIERIRQAGIEVTVGVLEQDCRWLNRRFFTYQSKHRPYIILKWAQTANGFIDNQGQSMPISNEQTRMLSHRLRAEEDAILVGHTTDFREHPQLNVRYWHGPDPRRLVLTHDRPLAQFIDDLFQQGVQSLIVEGGRQTHESFLSADLWDEIRVETAPVTVNDGTRAPQLPSNIAEYNNSMLGKNMLTYYHRHPF